LASLNGLTFDGSDIGSSTFGAHDPDSNPATSKPLNTAIITFFILQNYTIILKHFPLQGKPAGSLKPAVLGEPFGMSGEAASHEVTILLLLDCFGLRPRNDEAGYAARNRGFSPAM
jgi:hypothetical protein